MCNFSIYFNNKIIGLNMNFMDEEENYLMNNLNFLDYLYNIQVISDKQLLLLLMLLLLLIPLLVLLLLILFIA